MNKITVLNKQVPRHSFGNVFPTSVLLTHIFWDVTGCSGGYKFTDVSEESHSPCCPSAGPTLDAMPADSSGWALVGGGGVPHSGSLGRHTSTFLTTV
jgi:hypothetical protein